MSVWKRGGHEKDVIPTDMFLVIFADGCAMTRDHEKYPMNTVVCELAAAAEEAVHDLGEAALIYTQTDEISFIFKDPVSLIRSLGLDDETYINYALTIFLEKFLMQARYPSVPDAFFKGTVFYIRPEDVDDYLSERQSICHETAEMYVVKEHFPANVYTGKTAVEIRGLLKTHGFFDEVTKDPAFYDGILTDTTTMQNEIFLW